jgi:signal transduction histidine kinase/DNA-binding response OmpR family regulator/CHASE3 domain sensor protein
MEKASATIVGRLRLVFLVSAVLLLISSVASYYSIQKLIDNSKLVNHTYEILLESDKIVYALKDAETNHRGYLITHEAAFLLAYNNAYTRASEQLNKVKRLTQDNPVQQQNLMDVRKMLERRFDKFEAVLRADKARTGTTAYTINAEIMEGKRIMDQLTEVIDRVEKEEQQLLVRRTAAQNEYIGYAPLLIIAAALISMTITGLAYIRIKNDMEQRMAKQKEEQEKYLETSRRITTLESITQRIADGNYKVRSYDDKDDEMGRISKAMNAMAIALETNFNELERNSWLQAGAMSLSDAMRGRTDLHDLVGGMCSALADYLHSPLVACYLLMDDKYLKLIGGYAISDAPEKISYGEGLVGQAIKENKIITLDNIPADYIKVNSALGGTTPRYLTIVPVLVPGGARAAIEIGSLEKLTELQQHLLEQSREAMAIGIQSAVNYSRLQELFSETQAQSEELQMQHSELENINAELELQTQKLQASEEELKVQQEELMQANQELEERSRILEEKNQMIVERNLEIQQKAEELALSTKYKSEFLANMSHELRTPLNSILLLSRLLSENNEKNLSTDQVEYAQVIRTSGHGLLALIDEILDLSKIEAGKMELEYQPVPLEEIVNDLRAVFAPMAREKNLDFQVSIGPDLPLRMETDKMRLEQILKNLLSNALKFTSRGHVALNVSRGPQDSFVTFAVKDTGIGIAKEKQQLIFEAFQQADGSTRRNFGGTGLGLSISRELSRLLGGEIQIDSEPGKGSEFRVYVPVNRPTSAKEKTTPTPQELPVPKELPKTKPFAKDERKNGAYVTETIPARIPDDSATVQEKDKVILIVEDDTAFAKALLDYTHSQGYKGIIAVRGDEGIAFAQQYRPMGILLDIQLPVKDGWEVMEELKSNPLTRHIPVHIMSSLEVKKESLMKGAVDFINKPVAFEQMQEIFQKLEQVLSKKSKKVLIVEENTRHAKALAYFLETFHVSSEISASVSEGISALKRDDVDCVILDMGIPAQNAYQTLETVKQNPGMENLPIIIFTGKHLSKVEESKIKQYADTIVVKTAHSYQRILDEVSLFLHLVEENAQPDKHPNKYQRLGVLTEVLAHKKILITDDDVRNIFSLTKALEVHQMEVLSAMDGKEALRQLQEHPDIDIVLMDIMMPEMDGYEAMQEIRKNPKFRNLPIIAVTAKAMLGDREKCISAGASDYISKPVDADQLLSLLRVWLYEKGA